MAGRAVGDRRRRAAAPLPRACSRSRSRAATPTRCTSPTSPTACAWTTGATSSTARSSCSATHGELEPWPVDDPVAVDARRAPARAPAVRRRTRPTMARARGDGAAALRAECRRRASSTRPRPTGRGGTARRAARAPSAVGGAGEVEEAPVALAHAEVVDRPHVEPAELEHQEHLRGPAPDAAHERELAHDLVVGEARDAVELDVARRAPSRRGRGSTRPCCAERPARRAASRPGARAPPRASASPSKSGLEAAVDRARRRARELLVADRPHQLGEVRAARAAPAEVGGPERRRRWARTRGSCRASAALPSITARRATGGNRSRRASRRLRPPAGRAAESPDSAGSRPCVRRLACSRSSSRSDRAAVAAAVAMPRSARSRSATLARRPARPTPRRRLVHRHRQDHGHEARRCTTRPAPPQPSRAARQPVALRPDGARRRPSPRCSW